MIRVNFVGEVGHIDIVRNETMGVPNVGDTIRICRNDANLHKKVFSNYKVLSRTYLYNEFLDADMPTLMESKVLLTVLAE